MGCVEGRGGERAMERSRWGEEKKMRRREEDEEKKRRKSVVWNGIVLVLIRIRISMLMPISSVSDPRSGFLTPGSRIQDPEWVKRQHPDLGSGPGMNYPDHIS
jgi:hypothetical protein